MLKLKNVYFSYTADGEPFSASTTRSLRTEDVALTIQTEGDIFTATLNAAREIRLDHIRAVFQCPLDPTDRVFLNGYQSWTDSHEHGICDKMRGNSHIPALLAKKYAFSQYGDYNFVQYGTEAGQLHGWSYGYIRSRSDYNFIGSLAEDSGFTLLRLNAEKQELTIEKDCHGLYLTGAFDGLRLLLTAGAEKAVFDRYFDLLGVKLRSEVKPIFGYTSWYRHYQNISEPILMEDLAGLQAQRYKADVFQIDDGYQTAVGDWLAFDADKFPEGMGKIAAAVRKAGMRAGIWLAPFVCEETSDLCRNHPDWIVKDENGYDVKGGSNWSGFYALDIYNAEVREYLREVFRTITQDWGFSLLKLDFLYAACIVPRRNRTRGQIMADAMAFLREISGDALILGCGVPLASAFGRVDYCRIGCDVSPDWDDTPHMRLAHRERISTRSTILDSVFRRQLNGRAFLSDPDVFLLRDTENRLTSDEKLCLAEVNALCGSVLFTSDNAGSYNEAQQKVLDRIMSLRSEGELQNAEISNGLLKLTIRFRNKLIVRIYSL
ncbi:MAG: alpha-galactosidase [Oscillospiraceae bacterium]|nr:alpha-galactosidase [Oscillospiraceae bacterium]